MPNVSYQNVFNINKYIPKFIEDNMGKVKAIIHKQERAD